MNVKWTKESLCESLNQRVDRGIFSDSSYVMPLEITDNMLEAFQTSWDALKHNQIGQEKELKRFYQSLIGGF